MPTVISGNTNAACIHRNGDQHQRHIRHLPLGLGLSTSQDFNGDIAMIR